MGTIVKAGGRRRAVGALLDVTDRRAKDEQLRRAQKLDAVGQLTAGIAHNFNNMLMGVLPNVRLAAQRASRTSRRCSRGAEHSAERAANLVRRLMTYAGQHRPATLDVAPIAPLVGRAVAFCRTTFDSASPSRSGTTRPRRTRASTRRRSSRRSSTCSSTRATPSTDAHVESPHIAVDVDVVRATDASLGDEPRDFVRVRVDRPGAGHGRGDGGAHLRAVLHDEGGRQGDGARPGHDARDPPRARRVHHVHDRPWRWDDVLAPPAARRRAVARAARAVRGARAARQRDDPRRRRRAVESGASSR